MKKYLMITIILISFIAGCSIYKTIINVSRLKYKLDSVTKFKLNGIAIDSKSKLSDFGPGDMLKLTSVFSTGKFPVTFDLNILAKNPNDGTGGYDQTDITIKSFSWDLYLNKKKIVSGNIDKVVTVPGIGNSSIIPLIVKLDLIEFLDNGSFNKVIDLALKLGGKNKTTSEIEVIAKPVLGTPFGDLSYPEPVKIVDYQYN